MDTATGLNISSTTSLVISIAAAVLGMTGIAIYTAFGPPAKELNDPFEDHED